MLASNSTETILVADQNIYNSSASNNPALNTQDLSGSTPDKDKYVTLNSKEEWDKFFKLQNNPSTNITNKVRTKPHVRKNSNGMYRYTAEENKYNGKEIIGKVAEQIKEEISQKIKSDTMKLVKLKESKNEDNSVKPAIRIVLNDNVKEINMADLLSGSVCKEYNVKAITFCFPDKSNTRGIRCRIDEHGTRIYEVANGSYEMDLRWYCEGKECKIKILMKDDGSIRLIEDNGITEEQLKAHKEIRVGRQYEAKSLHEALALQLPQLQQKCSETTEILSRLADVSTSQAQQVLSAQVSK
ncbi:hypothetical protein [Wolbachia endosymbiont of Brugia malayi]|uniref:hypothetical protein n=1 Tax=Wolbachia endosymbiont of Brugia malayi TaxID=80849 RepID=UPI0002FBF1BB|nr:hypothetical protein [Wolbachia endosymbiont of Brugia malayi]